MISTRRYRYFQLGLAVCVPARMADTNGGQKSVVQQVIQAVLGIQEWTRAFILVMLGVVALGGMLVWTERDRIGTMLLDWSHRQDVPQIAGEKIRDQVAAELAKSFTPNYGAGIWDVQLGQNRKRLLSFALGDVPLTPELERDMAPGRMTPLLMRGKMVRNALIVAVLEGEVECDDLTTISGGVGRGCFVGIPHEVGELVGVIGLLLPRERPFNDEDEALLRTALIDASTKLTVWK